MKNFCWFGPCAVIILLAAPLSAQASIDCEVERPEPKLAFPQKEDRLADALSPIHFYLRQNLMIRLAPTSPNMFSQRFRGLNRGLSPIQNR